MIGSYFELTHCSLDIVLCLFALGVMSLGTVNMSVALTVDAPATLDIYDRNQFTGLKYIRLEERSAVDYCVHAYCTTTHDSLLLNVSIYSGVCPLVMCPIYFTTELGFCLGWKGQ